VIRGGDLMKKLEVLLIALAGAAAAIPGIAITLKFPLPAGTAPLFQFALATFSAAVVLLGYIARKPLQQLSVRSAVLGGTLGLLTVLALFVAHVWLTDTVLVEHSYDASPPKFFPLFLDDRGRQLVDSLGGRRKVIETPGFGPGVVTALTTEKNAAMTMGTLLASYTALIGGVSLLFALLGFHALGAPEELSEDDGRDKTDPPIGEPGQPPLPTPTQ